MPSTSKSQQRLFCMAYAVRKGKIKRSDANEEVLKIADGDMTDQEIKDFMKLKESQFISLQTYITERLNPKHLGSANTTLGLISEYLNDPNTKSMIQKIWKLDNRQSHVLLDYACRLAQEYAASKQRDWPIRFVQDLSDNGAKLFIGHLKNTFPGRYDYIDDRIDSLEELFAEMVGKIIEYAKI